MTTSALRGLHSAADGARAMQQNAWTEHIMGMPISIHLRGSTCRDAEASQAVAAVFEQLRGIDEMFSLWKPNSVLSRLRRGELALSQCPAEMHEIYRLCLRAQSQTCGWFDAWYQGPGMAGFDPTGVVKGWGVQAAASVLLDRAQEDFYINAGGDIIAWTWSEHSPPWRIGIEDPRDRHRIAAVVPVHRGGLATSGNAARGPHILVPGQDRCAGRLLSVTVWGPSLAWCDVLATAGFAAEGASDWLAAKSSEYGVLILEQGESPSATLTFRGTDDHEVLLMTDEGRESDDGVSAWSPQW